MRSLDLAECPPTLPAPLAGLGALAGAFTGARASVLSIAGAGAGVPSILSADVPSLPTDGQAEGYVCNGSLVSFVSNLTGQQKQDVLDSSLLAQLAANKKYDREKDTENWYKFYTKVMENVGWVIQGFQFNKHESKQSDFKLSQLPLEILSGLVGGTAEILKVLKATLDVLAKSSEGVTLFGSNSTSDKNGNMLVMPCTVDKSNQITVSLMGFIFEADSSADNYFFFTWKSQHIKLYKSSQTCTLNEDAYADVRDDVREKLKGKRKSNIKKLELPDIDD